MRKINIKKARKLMLSKKGDERFLSLWWFFVLVIIAVGVFAAAIIFNSKLVDVRGIEADIITDKIISCLIKQGEINSDFMKGSFDFYSRCGLNKDIIEGVGEKEGKYFFEVRVYDFDSCKEVENKIVCDIELENLRTYKGIESYREFCELEGDKLPQCTKKKIYALSDDKKFVVSLLAASDQQGALI